MKFLILGGTGFIGRHVARRLSEDGHAVAIFHRGQTEVSLPSAIRFIHGDRARLQAFGAEFRRLAPDVVIDINPYTEFEATVAMRVFRTIARRFVAVSSGDVYRRYDWFRKVAPAPPEGHALKEDAPLRENLYPYRAYAAGPTHMTYNYEKILVERAVLGDAQLPGTVLRLPMVYGPGDRQHRLSAYLKRMDDRRPVIVLEARQAEWRCSRGYVENVAAAVARAATDLRAVGQVYNVGEADSYSEAEWVASVGRVAGWKGQVVALPQARVPKSLPVLPVDWGQHLVTDTSRLREQLEFTDPIPREEGLRWAVLWERANPPAEVGSEHFDYAAEDAALEASGWQAGPGRGTIETAEPYAAADDGRDPGS